MIGFRLTMAVVALLELAVVLLFVGFMAFPALPHEAESGWSYPLSCCSDRDCRHVEAGAVRQTPDGYQIAATGEILPYADRRIRPSPDGLYHWCADAASPRTICLFVPVMAF